MKTFIKYVFGIGVVLFILTWVSGAVPHLIAPAYIPVAEPPLPVPQPCGMDTDSLRYPIHDRYGDKVNNPEKNSMDLKDPSNVTTKVEYNPEENEYDISEKMGTLDYRPPSYMTFDEYIANRYKQSTHDYWLEKTTAEDKITHGRLIAPIKIPGKAFKNIFGSDVIDIRPQGSAELIFALNIAKNQNPNLPVSQQTVSTFDFKEKIQMNVTAQIGDKVKLATNYNTEATFEFENKMKLQYQGHEDEIIKDIEAGNVTLPLTGTLITGSQSLFGLKTQLQFGALTVTSIFSQQKGKSSSITVQGGAQTTNFDFKADQYEANKHYFLAQYFADSYDHALSQLPVILSGITITKVEVWVTNKTGITTNTRNIFAFADLGEYNFDPSITNNLLNHNGVYNQQLPSDSSNNLFQTLFPGGPTDTTFRNIFNASSKLTPYGPANNFTASKNWEKVENARLLSTTEYTLNPLLGYISLNQALNSDEVLGIAFQYTINGVPHQVGDFSTDGINPPNAIFVKLLKSTVTNPRMFTWGLMMKNIYSLGAYGVTPTNFQLEVLYQDDALGTRINYIPEGCDNIKNVRLIKLLNLDRMNTNHDPYPDGIFDIIDGVTINLSNGRIIFPQREPFGSYLKGKFCAGDQSLINKYAFQDLYDSTKTAAQQEPEKNKFSLKGHYQGTSGSDIPLNAVNIPQGSVTVTAGGILLKENVDYTVDYTLGRVKIINQGYLNSNTPLKINLESNSLFNIQSKTLWGSRFDYVVNKDFTLGGTFLHLSERPLTQKVNVGDEPISNTIWGVDGTYRKDSRFLTKMVDKLPFIQTKEPSNITLTGEFADLMPGHASAIGSSGTSYIDDFEAAVTPIDIKNPGGWYLASTPQYQNDLFPEGNLADSLPYGYNRSLFAWYIIDPLFQQQSGITPGNISSVDMNNNYVREIPETEIFPNQSSITPTAITCLNLAFYPNQRGPYNYDADPNHVSADGTFKDAPNRWGGIMRRVETNDFEASNIGLIHFWMMDPFNEDNPRHTTTQGGDLYFDLGNVSEDVLRDSHKSFENGLPASTNNYTYGTSSWGRFPTIQSVVNAFDNDQSSRAQQDVGLDGLGDADEQSFFKRYLDSLATAFGTNSPAYQSAIADPSSDDYTYFQSDIYDQVPTSVPAKVLERYKKYNNMEGNSPVPPTVHGYTATGTNIPDAEDINRDNNMNETESYFQYRVRLRPNEMVVGQNDITDMITTSIQGQPGRTIKWYEFKIPIHQPDQTINGIEDFKSIRFIRMFMKGWQDSVVCRMAQLEFQRSDWRKYDNSLLGAGENIAHQYPGNTTFDESGVSIVDNGNRQPINYVLPPGISRQIDPTTQTAVQLNEASLSLKICSLDDGDARAVYKTMQQDFRPYGKMQAYVHAEGAGQYLDALKTGDLTAFIRIGSDFTENYYEYEIPLAFTKAGEHDPNLVWPAANDMVIDLNQLVQIKEQRNNDPNISDKNRLLLPYPANGYLTAGGAKIYVVGSPNLGNVQTMMLGIRNPKNPNDNGAALCGEIWFDELRLTDFNEHGGWAANLRVAAKLADLGTATLAGTHSTAGFGSIEQTITQRSVTETTGYDFSTNLELGKFLPKKSGIRVPFFFGYSETFVTPEYDPLDPDVLFKDAPQRNQDIGKDYTRRKSLNFTNVKKNKTGGGKSHLYDVENLTLSYAYTESLHHDVSVAENLTTEEREAIAYNFTNTPKNVSPFSKTKIFNGKYLRFIKDFNFYYAPSSVAIRYDLDRQFAETRLRDVSGFSDVPLDTSFSKSFTFNRAYDLKYDLTKSLKFDFTSQAQARIDEPPGELDTKAKRDAVIDTILNFGRLTSYHHSANLNYNVPLNKFPFLDWVTVNARYGADYGWLAGPLIVDSASGNLVQSPNRNTINNAQNKTLNGQLTMSTLYNKVAFLKKLNAPPPVRPPAPKVKPKPPPKPKTAADSIKYRAYLDSLKRNAPPPILVTIGKSLGRLVLSLKSVSFSYTETNAMSFPGFQGHGEGTSPNFVGNDWSGGIPAPGLDFVAGSQNEALFKQRFTQDGWLGTDTALNAPFSRSQLRNFSGRASLEPIRNFKIELTATRNYSLNHTEYFKSTDGGNTFSTLSPLDNGNFSMSYLTWNTAFVKDNGDHENATFQKFSDNRLYISQRLGKQNRNSTGIDSAGFYNGYGPNQQDVLTYAFLSAYSGKSPASMSLSQFPAIPLPNWRITYDGLGKLPALQKIFSSVNLSHGYRSLYTVSSFTQNLLYSPDPFGNDLARDVQNNFITKFTYQQVSISEQFSPLIGIDMQFKNSLQARVEIKQDRTVSLSYENSQVTEIRGWEYDFGLGYRIHKFRAPFKISGNRPSTGDLNLKAEFDLRNNYTIIRQLDLNTNQPVAGAEIVAINLSADYAVNDRFNIKLFMIETINTPYVSLTYPTSNVNAGFSLRFTLAQ